MIKPIVYRNFEEKEVLEKKPHGCYSYDKRLSASEALTDIKTESTTRIPLPPPERLRFSIVIKMICNV